MVMGFGKFDERMRKSEDRQLRENGFLVKTGEALREYYPDKRNFKHRDFVHKLVSVLRMEHIVFRDNVVGIFGIRGVGKSIGILHTIDVINDYENTVYIRVLTQGKKMEALRYLMSKYSHCKYFFIEEIDYISDFVENFQWLYEDYVCTGKKTVVSARSSYALNVLIVRKIIKYTVNHISYKEQHRLTGISLEEYLQSGGVLDKDLLAVDNAEELLSVLVVDDLVNFISYHRKILRDKCLISERLFHLENEQLYKYVKSIVYCIYYMIIIGNVKNISNPFVCGDGEVYKKYFASSGISFDFEWEDFRKIYHYLKKGTDCLYSAYNAVKDPENVYGYYTMFIKLIGLSNNGIRDYITMPYLSNVLYRDFCMVAYGMTNHTTLEKAVFADVGFCEMKRYYGSYRYISAIGCLVYDSYYDDGYNGDGKRTLIVFCSDDSEEECIKAGKVVKHPVKNRIICTAHEFYDGSKELEDNIVMVSFNRLFDYLDKNIWK